MHIVLFNAADALLSPKSGGDGPTVAPLRPGVAVL